MKKLVLEYLFLKNYRIISYIISQKKFIKNLLIIVIFNFPNIIYAETKHLPQKKLELISQNIKWKKISNANARENFIEWKDSKENGYFDNKNKYQVETFSKTNFKINSLNRSVIFDNKIVGPDIGWLVPPGFAWNKKYKFDGSVRGHSRRRKNEKFLHWNGGDAVGQFYYQFLNGDKTSFGLNMGMRSVYSGNVHPGGGTPVGEGLSTGFRWDYELSSRSGISFGAEQLLHFDGLTDTGRDIYMTYSKGWWNKNIEGLFPLYTFTGGFGTGKLSEGAIKGLCSDLFGGGGIDITEQRRLCWAPIFSIARVENESFSTFLEYNSNSLIFGTSLAPLDSFPLRGTFAVKLADEDNYEINKFSEMTWIFRVSLGF